MAISGTEVLVDGEVIAFIPDGLSGATGLRGATGPGVGVTGSTGVTGIGSKVTVTRRDIDSPGNQFHGVTIRSEIVGSPSARDGVTIANINDGATGRRGLSGVSGVTGITGVSGVSGATGPGVGSTGATGPSPVITGGRAVIGEPGSTLFSDGEQIAFIPDGKSGATGASGEPPSITFHRRVAGRSGVEIRVDGTHVSEVYDGLSGATGRIGPRGEQGPGVGVTGATGVSGSFLELFDRGPGRGVRINVTQRNPDGSLQDVVESQIIEDGRPGATGMGATGVSGATGPISERFRVTAERFEDLVRQGQSRDGTNIEIWQRHTGSTGTFRVRTFDDGVYRRIGGSLLYDGESGATGPGRGATGPRGSTGIQGPPGTIENFSLTQQQKYFLVRDVVREDGRAHDDNPLPGTNIGMRLQRNENTGEIQLRANKDQVKQWLGI